jgi:hypothetical protein
MPQALEVPPGIYQHYKGDKYRVLFVANDSSNSREGNKLVVYVSLKHGTLNCRDLDEFTEVVDWPDGSRKSRFIGTLTSFKNPTRKK